MKTSVAAGFILLVILIFGCTSNDISTESSFNAIDLVKSKIPSDMKNRMWYIEEWKQEEIEKITWKVYVSDANWKVSKSNKLCSETREFVSVCSDNGVAKRYSNLVYCKPSTFCEHTQIEVSDINIPEELKKIDLSNLSYLEEEADGWKYTKVENIPEIIRKAINYQAAKYERDNPNATYTVTCSVLAKRYGLPEKAVKAIYFEGSIASKGWPRPPVR